MLKIYDDLLKATDNGLRSAPCLLNLTAAFDTVNHELLWHDWIVSFDVRRRVLASVQIVLNWPDILCDPHRNFVFYQAGDMLLPQGLS